MAVDQKEGDVRDAGEAYTFQYSEQELRAIAKDGCASLIRRTAVFSAIYIVLLLFLIESEAPHFLVGSFFWYLSYSSHFIYQGIPPLQKGMGGERKKNSGMRLFLRDL